MTFLAVKLSQVFSTFLLSFSTIFELFIESFFTTFFSLDVDFSELFVPQLKREAAKIRNVILNTFKR